MWTERASSSALPPALALRLRATSLRTARWIDGPDPSRGVVRPRVRGDHAGAGGAEAADRSQLAKGLMMTQIIERSAMSGGDDPEPIGPLLTDHACGHQPHDGRGRSADHARRDGGPTRRALGLRRRRRHPRRECPASPEVSLKPVRKATRHPARRGRRHHQASPSGCTQGLRAGSGGPVPTDSPYTGRFDQIVSHLGRSTRTRTRGAVNMVSVQTRAHSDRSGGIGASRAPSSPP